MASPWDTGFSFVFVCMTTLLGTIATIPLCVLTLYCTPQVPVGGRELAYVYTSNVTAH